MIQSVRIGKRDWAVGLTWRSYDTRPRRAEIRADAASLKTEWIVERITTDAIQVGYAEGEPETSGQKPDRLYSLAAAVAACHPQPWLGIFRLADGLWWYVAVRRGHAILPDGDVVGGEAEMETARAKHEGFSDWNFVKGDIGDLSSLLADQGRTLALCRVQSFEAPSFPKPAIAGLGLAAVAVGGIFWWHHNEAVERARREAALAAARARLAEEAVAVSPLIAMPKSSSILAACEAVFAHLPMALDGWALNGVGCGADGVHEVWQRLPGATAALRPAGELINNGNVVEGTQPLPTLPPGGDDAAGFDASNTALYALLQRVGVEAAISPPALPAVLPGAPRPTPGQVFAREDVSFSLPFAPFLFDWDSVKGFRLTSIQLGPLGGGADGGAMPDWTVTGVIYER